MWQALATQLPASQPARPSVLQTRRSQMRSARRARQARQQATRPAAGDRMCVLIDRWECNSPTPGVICRSAQTGYPWGPNRGHRAMDAESLGVGAPIRHHGPEHPVMCCRSAWYAFKAELKLASATAQCRSPDTLRGSGRVSTPDWRDDGHCSR
jgi:hypothetical protein